MSGSLDPPRPSDWAPPLDLATKGGERRLVNCTGLPISLQSHSLPIQSLPISPGHYQSLSLARL